MKFDFKINCFAAFMLAVFMMACNCLFAQSTPTPLDLDSAVWNDVNALAISVGPVSSASASTLSSLSSVLTAANNFLSAGPSGVPAASATSTPAVTGSPITSVSNLLTFASQIVQQASDAKTSASTSGTTSPPTASIDTTIQNAIATALKSSTIAAQVIALNAIATNSTYKTATVLLATQTAFAAAIMSVGGTYIYTNYKKLNTFYAKIYAEIKAKKKLTATDKKNIKNMIAPYIKSVGGNLTNFQTLLKDSTGTTLLTANNVLFVNTYLIAAVKVLIYLDGIK